jgi:hypothetical protein
MTERGQITYTERAFEQDADLAMSSDVMRALVELVTNADDAFGANPGDVLVEIVRNKDEPTRLIVRDTAKGLTPDQLKSCFSVLGEKQSELHGHEEVRGHFGRGAKDTAAFGRTIFESIFDGIYGRFELARSGAWELDQAVATGEHYSSLRIPDGGAGLSATVVVEKDGITVPAHRTLVYRLSRHVQLRRINTARQIIVEEFAPDGRKASGVARWDEPPGELIVDTTVEIPSYDTTISVSVRKLATPAEGRLDNYSIQGIEIRGAKATYANTLFGASTAEGSWIRGVVDCTAIDDLLKDYDEARGNPANPTRIIRRDRDGLNEEHPFYTELAKAVLSVVGPILDDLKPNREALGGQQLRQDLDRAGRALAELLRSDLQRIDEDEAPGGLLPTRTSPLLVIPPRVTLAAGAVRSLTVLVRPEDLPEPLNLTAAVVDGDVVDMDDFQPLRPHPRLEGVQVANLPITALANGMTVLTVSAGTGHSASCEIRVQDSVPLELQPPEELRWSNKSMSVMVGRERTVELVAPIELAADGYLQCTVSSSSDAVTLESNVIELELNRDGWLSGRCRITGRTVDASAVLTAVAGDSYAEGRVRVTTPGSLSGMGIQIQIDDDTQGSQRGSLEVTDAGFLVRVFGGHLGIRSLLGPPSSDGTFPNEQAAPARIVIAEVIASVIADWLLIREAHRFPESLKDADAVLAERTRTVSRYLGPIQKTLLSSFGNV